jgi:tetratricopeptide (TPR) repeat protein
MTPPAQPVSIEEAVKLAQSHHQAGRLGEAESLYRQILAVNPNQYDALHLLGILGSQIGRLEQAAELISRAIQLQPLNHAAHNNLGETLAKAKRLDEAIVSFRRAIELKPDYFHAQYNLGVALVQQGNGKEGLELIEKAMLAQGQTPTQAKINLARTHQKLGNHGIGSDLMVKETGFIRFAENASIKLFFQVEQKH